MGVLINITIYNNIQKILTTIRNLQSITLINLNCFPRVDRKKSDLKATTTATAATISHSAHTHSNTQPHTETSTYASNCTVTHDKYST